MFYQEIVFEVATHNVRWQQTARVTPPYLIVRLDHSTIGRKCNDGIGPSLSGTRRWCVNHHALRCAAATKSYFKMYPLRILAISTVRFSFAKILIQTIYVRINVFSAASGRRFVGRILLLVFLQMACCSHCSDALACELLMQNSGQLTGRHLTRKMLSRL